MSAKKKMKINPAGKKLKLGELAVNFMPTREHKAGSHPHWKLRPLEEPDVSRILKVAEASHLGETDDTYDHPLHSTAVDAYGEEPSPSRSPGHAAAPRRNNAGRSKKMHSSKASARNVQKFNAADPDDESLTGNVVQKKWQKAPNAIQFQVNKKRPLEENASGPSDHPLHSTAVDAYGEEPSPSRSPGHAAAPRRNDAKSKKMHSSKASARNVQKFNAADPEDESLTGNVVQKKLQKAPNAIQFQVKKKRPLEENASGPSDHPLHSTAVDAYGEEPSPSRSPGHAAAPRRNDAKSKKMHSSKASARNVQKFNAADPEDESVTGNVVQKKWQKAPNAIQFQVKRKRPLEENASGPSDHPLHSTAVDAYGEEPSPSRSPGHAAAPRRNDAKSKKMHSSKASARNVQKFNAADPEDESLTGNVVQKKLQKAPNAIQFQVKKKRPLEENVSEPSAHSPYSVQVWCPKHLKRSATDITELDVVLAAFEKIVANYRQSIESNVCRKAIDSFCSAFTDQVTDLIVEVQESNNVKKKNAKVIRNISKKRLQLWQLRGELTGAESQLIKLLREYDEIRERRSSLRQATELLLNVMELQEDCLDYREENPGEKFVYGTSSLPALLVESRRILGAERHFEDINMKLEEALDVQREMLSNKYYMFQ